MVIKETLPVSELTRVFRVADDGLLFWIEKPSRGSPIRVGGVAGFRRKDGYQIVKLRGRAYMAHRIVFAMTHGHWPDHQIDHINGDPSDNRVSNLRDIPQAVNTQNLRRPTRLNSSGLLGVSPSFGKWKAQISIGGTRKLHLGQFETPEAAHAAYLEAKRKHHEGCTI